MYCENFKMFKHFIYRYPGVYTETSWYGEWIRTAITPTEEDPSPVVDGK